MQAGGRWWTGSVRVSPPFLRGAVTAHGAADAAPVEGAFTLRPASPERSRVGSLPVVGHLARAVNAAEPVTGRVEVRFAGFEVHGRIVDGACVHAEARRGGRVRTATLECDALLRSLDELGRAVRHELDRLADRDPRDRFEAVLLGWRAARLWLGVGRLQHGSDAAQDVLRDLRGALRGGPLTDPRLRDLAADLADRLDGIPHPKRAGRLRALLGEPPP